MSETETDRLLLPSEVAVMFQVTTKTVQRWGKTGKLPSVVRPSGQRRYRLSQVREFLITGDIQE